MSFLLVSGCALLLVVTASSIPGGTIADSEKEIIISKDYKRTSDHHAPVSKWIIPSFYSTSVILL